MACTPCAARAANRPVWQVKDASGRVVYESTSRPAADGVASRYPGGEVTAKQAPQESGGSAAPNR
ncbi:hypothetical protein ABT352_23055 [Streptosporangium sp. NPDC000563]|uniref:hypothetical protein n=1 Tax=Streptosporangium sp. NPDC000563 TaxID=3154366 RepID=UPI00331CE3D5